MSVNDCPDDIFSVGPVVSAQYLLKYSTFLKKFFFFFTKLSMVVYYDEVMCHVKNWFIVFGVKVKTRAYIIKI